MIVSAHPASTRGAYRDRHGRRKRDAVDAWVCSALARRRTHPGVRRNRAVPIPRRWNQALRDERKATAANKPGTPRRSRISRKTIAQGTPVVPAALSLLACVKCTFLCTQDPRVRPASGVPCALLIERDNADAKLGQFLPRERRSLPLRRHCERSDLSAVAQRAKAEAIQSLA